MVPPNRPTKRASYGARLFRRGTLACAALALGAGCAAAWSLRTAAPVAALQWPPAPAPPKLTLRHALVGLDRSSDAGSVLRAVAFGSDPEEQNAFVLPVAVAVSRDGRVAVADVGRRCVHLFAPGERRYVRVVGADQEPLVSPVGVAFDDESRLYVSDSAGRVSAFGADGAPRFTISKAGERPLRRPTGIAFNPRTKSLYVVDTLAGEVDVFGVDGEFEFAFGARGEDSGRLNFPTHAFWSPRGELYVTDSLNFRIQIFDESGKPLGHFGHHGDASGDLALPKGVAVDRDGVVYVVDGLFDNVQLFDREGRFLLTLGGRGTELGEFWLPSGSFIDDEDTLYVCDTYNRRIQVFRITRGYAVASS